MALTRDFRETIRERAQKEPKFRRALLQEAIEQLLSGDVAAGKSMIRDYIYATVGFQELSRATATRPESLMRMFSPSGNPSATNLLGVIAELQHREGIHFTLKTIVAQAITTA